MAFMLAAAIGCSDPEHLTGVPGSDHDAAVASREDASEYIPDAPIIYPDAADRDAVIVDAAAERDASSIPDAMGLPDAATLDGGAELVSRVSVGALDMAVDNSKVYWTENQYPGSVNACAKDACTPSAIATMQLGPFYIRVDDAFVYWTVLGYALSPQGQVAKCAIGGCGGAPTLIADHLMNQGISPALAIDSTNAYYREGLDNLRASRLSAAGGMSMLLTSTMMDHALAVGNGRLYFALGNPPYPIVSCPTQSPCGSPTVEIADANADDIAFHGGSLFWAEVTTGSSTMTLSRCDATQCAATRRAIARVTNTAGFRNGIHLAVDDSRIYYRVMTDLNRRLSGVYSIAADGSGTAPKKYADRERWIGPLPLALDDQNVYWANAWTSTAAPYQPGEIWRAPK
jgi:hypothetical protein